MRSPAARCYCNSPRAGASLIEWNSRLPTRGATWLNRLSGAELPVRIPDKFAASVNPKTSINWRDTLRFTKPVRGGFQAIARGPAVSIVLRSCRRNFPAAIPALELAAELSELSERARALALASLPRPSSSPSSCAPGRRVSPSWISSP